MKEASALMTASQYGGGGIREKNSELRKAWTELQNLASGRKHMLNDAMEAQKVSGTAPPFEVIWKCSSPIFFAYIPGLPNQYCCFASSLFFVVHFLTLSPCALCKMKYHSQNSSRYCTVF